MRKLKTILLVIIITGTILQTSCWDLKELQTISIVLATGIDITPNGQTKVIVQTINPSASPGGSSNSQGGGGSGKAIKPYSNFSSESSTIMESIRDLSRTVSRQLFFAHNQVIIISEKLATEKGVQGILDFFLRNPQIRRTTWILIARGDLAGIMNEPGRLEKIPAQRIAGIIDKQDLHSKYAAQRIGDFADNLQGKSEAYTAIVERMPSKALPNLPDSTMSGSDITDPQNDLIITGTAVFKEDKMVGVLNTTESRGLLWILGDVKGGVIEVEHPGPKAQVSLEILRSRTSQKAEIKDGNIHIAVKVKPISNVTESTGNLDLMNDKTIKELESLQNQKIENEIKAVLDKAQTNYNADIFDFSSVVHRQYPQQWKSIQKDWHDMFPTIQVSVEVESSIKRTGLITEPLNAQ